MTGMADNPDGPDPIANVSWSHRALELYIASDVETAMAEIGPERMQLLHSALQAASGHPEIPRPGHPQWEHYLGFLQARMERELGSPLDSARDEPDYSTVTMTEGYGVAWPPT